MKIEKRAALRDAILKNYGSVATSDSSGCCGSGSSCCSPGSSGTDGKVLGYSEEDLASVPEGANLGLGCGNPQALAQLKPGETVLDLGSGAGFDVFLASKRIGSTGKVIGVDMTPEMVAKARRNAEKGNYANVEFRLGEIENLPVEDDSIDVIISNCVVNLSTDKPRVFAEAFRVLKPGGRLAISDVVATADLPKALKDDARLHSACIAGASTIEDLEVMLQDAGFTKVRIEPKDSSKAFIRTWAPGSKVGDYHVSAAISAIKGVI
ncbi:MAG: arsM [Spirochaetes bacterium]|nr:MAG: arsM [Spirochaetota bacterium]